MSAVYGRGEQCIESLIRYFGGNGKREWLAEFDGHVRQIV
jgi:hypothetical protein